MKIGEKLSHRFFDFKRRLYFESDRFYHVNVKSSDGCMKYISFLPSE